MTVVVTFVAMFVVPLVVTLADKLGLRLLGAMT